MTAVIPVANIATAGTAWVTVVNPGTSAVSNVVFMPVVAPSSTVFYSNAPGSPIYLGSVDDGKYPNMPLSMAVGDFSGDGRLDLALGMQEDSNPAYLSVFLGIGDGTFTPLSSTAPLGATPGAMAVGDFNGDGKLDLAVTNFNDSTVSILLGNGDGTFTPAPGSPVSVGGDPSGVVAADFNGDGKLDLAVTNGSENNLTILLGNGDGTFSTVASSPATGLTPCGLAVGDFNGDGKLDLAVANFDQNVVTVLLGNGDGTFTPAASPTVPGGGFPIATADFNGDGRLDLAMGQQGGGTVNILLGNGDGTFAPVSGCCGPSLGTNPFAIAIGDFNGDGKPDIAIAMQDLPGLNDIDYVVILLGKGDGTFTHTDFTLLVPPDPFSFGVGDFNGDGQLDFATASDPYNYVSVMLQTPSGPAPDFTVAVAGSPASVQPGGTAKYTLQLQSLNGFLGSVSVSCSGAPNLATCSPAVPSVVLTDTEIITFMLSVTTTALAAQSQKVAGSSGAPAQRRGMMGLSTPLLGLMLVAVPIGIRRRHRRACPQVLLGAVLMCIVFMASCGGSTSSSPPPGGGTPPGTYTLTVAATSGSPTHSTTFVLTVE